MSKPAERARILPPLLLGLTLNTVVPLVVHGLLRARGALWHVWLAAAAVLVCAFLAARSAGKATAAWKAALVGILALDALFILGYLLIIPYPVFEVWFSRLGAGRAEGMVSQLFTLGAAFFTAAASSFFFSHGIARPLYWLGVGLAVLFSLLLPGIAAVIVVLALIFAGVLVDGILRQDKKSRGRWASRFGVFGLATGVGILLCGLVLPLRSQDLIDRVVAPWMKRMVVALFPDFPMPQTLPGYTNSLGTGILGGPVNRSTAPIFRIASGREGTVYLRVEALDTYTDGGWTTFTASPLDLESANDLSASGGSPTLQTGESAERRATVEMNIDVLMEAYGRFPVTSDTVSITFNGRRFPVAAERIQRAETIVGPLLTYGDRIVLGLDPDYHDDPGLSAGERARFLAVPSRLEARLSGIAASLRGETVQQTLLAILFYLRDFTYKLEVRSIPRGRDFIEYFLLESREGYCDYFASAFAMLARLNGIPTRYCQGFLASVHASPPVPEGEALRDADLVTGYSAHAWPEVWIEGEGWFVWEATPPLNPAIVNGEGFEEYLRSLDRNTLRQVLALTGKTLPETERTDPPGSVFFGGNAEDSRRAFVRILVAFGVAAILIVLFQLLRYFYRRPAPAFRLMARMVRSAERLGVPSPRTSGWIRWTDTAAAHYTRLRAPLRRARGLILGLAYGGVPSTRRTLRYLTLLERRMYRAWKRRKIG